MRRKNAWTTYNKKQLDELEKLCKNYLKERRNVSV